MSLPVKFVITGLGRCGSNLLKFALKTHPAIKLSGEYFNQRVYPDSVGVNGWVRAEKYFNNYRPHQTAIGFKIFFHHARKKGVKKVWSYLKSQDVYVIHLSRRNAFKRILSLEVARQHNQWLSTSGPNSEIQVNYPAGWWLQQIVQDNEKEARLSDYFESNNYLRVFYEDLIENWPGTTADIQKFLLVKERPLKQLTQKQETLPPWDRCPNYDALQAYFSQTKHAWMFDDHGLDRKSIG